ncbi:MAG: SDR family oxidoreductase, partial [SAR202 cluster bacterium]|nr:SDR family oxidoreductase [SAR202 cluster bacterium]
AKHGVVGLTRTAALQYAQDGIRINAVCPGYIETPMTAGIRSDSELGSQITAKYPIGRMGTPEETAQAEVWLFTGGASFVTGRAMAVDGNCTAQ